MGLVIDESMIGKPYPLLCPIGLSFCPILGNFFGLVINGP